MWNDPFVMFLGCGTLVLVVIYNYCKYTEGGDDRGSDDDHHGA